MDDTELLAIWWCLIVLAFLLGTAWVCNKLTKRNRRTGLRAPFPDDRCSIRNFKRMTTP
jgi:hypothetical protein